MPLSKDSIFIKDQRMQDASTCLPSNFGEEVSLLNNNLTV